VTVGPAKFRRFADFPGGLQVGFLNYFPEPLFFKQTNGSIKVPPAESFFSPMGYWGLPAAHRKPQALAVPKLLGPFLLS
jgi:hypothetical protein